MNRKMKTSSDENLSKNKQFTIRAKKNNSRDSFGKFQDEFINSVSHQFRTPLATLYSSVDLLEYYFMNNNNQRRDDVLVKIKKTLRYLIETLDNITTLYKYSLPKQKLSLRKINLRKFINNLLDEVVTGLGNSHFLLVNISPHIEFIICDEFMLNQVLINLISNAIKFSPDGGQIMVDVSEQKKHIEFIIRDEGIGIPKNELKKIFIPFIRGKNASAYEGVGMGLAIVKNMMRLLNGTIECVSVLSQGTQFRVTLPKRGKYEENTYH